MNAINNTLLRFRAYQYGEELPERLGGMKPPCPHSFDISNDDAEIIVKALGVMLLLSVQDYPHNFQNERKDIVRYCKNMTKLQKIAKAIATKAILDDGTKEANK